MFKFNTRLIEDSYQSHIIKKELSKQHNENNLYGTKKSAHPQTLKEKALHYWVLFLDTSSIHGLNHLVVTGRHPCESLLWCFLLILSVFGAGYLSWSIWIRYQSSPTVVSMDRDMYSWNTSFPAVTICLDKKLDPEKVDAYVMNSNVEDKEKFKLFLMTLSAATYETFYTIPKYEGFKPSKYMELLTNLTAPFNPTLTIGATGIKLEIIPTVTEMGLCYSINSHVAVYNSPKYRQENRWNVVKSNTSTFFVHPLDGEVFAQLINIPSSYTAYIHGPAEVPDIATKSQRSATNFYMKIYVTASTVYTSEEASKLTVGQRRCRFIHENNLKHFPVYTYSMCRMECRVKLCLEYCNCIPHFYRPIGNEKICDVTGLKCLSAFSDILYKLRDKSGKKVKCECFPICDDVNYVIQTNSLQEWFLSTNFQWGMVTYPRMRYRRDIIFGFTDFLVAVGGMAGLFLGCSVLSFMEIIYFVTLRLCCYTYDGLKKK